MKSSCHMILGRGDKTIISSAYVFLVGFSQITDLKKKKEEEEERKKCTKV